MSTRAVRLTISVVLYEPDVEALRTTLRSLQVALQRARETGVLSTVTLWLVDNGSTDPDTVDRLASAAFASEAGVQEVAVLRGHGNVGYGQGHNLAIRQAAGEYHLVLNADVEVDPDALLEAIRYLEAHRSVGMITPFTVGETGARQYLAKRYPSVVVLGLRGFAPAWLRRLFRRRLAWYEMRDLPDNAPSTVLIAGGAFMLCRRDLLQAVEGFSPEFFLYFEDFDLSLRLGRRAEIAYVPAVRIRHTGGDAARKGWAHRRMFIRSGVTFFRRHGWRVW